ncbi:MAG: AI-2E family transporter [Actinobacteria bacterium]|nr:AI-2E family transporter [Actinomycetota bacterium]
MFSERLRQAALLTWIAVGVLVLGFVLLRVADSIRVIWLPIAFAFGLVFLLEPAVKGFERLRVPRALGSILAFLVLVALVVASFALLFPTISDQAVAFASQLPDLYASVTGWLRDAGDRLGIDVDAMLSQSAIEQWLNDPANQETVQQIVFGFGAGAGQVIRGVTEAIAVLGLAPVLALYILIDLERFKSNAIGLTPPRYQEEVAYVGSEVGLALGSFVRGQLLVAVIVGIASSAALWFIDLPFWLLIGILAGFLNLIPFLGPIVGGALAVLVALLNGDPWQALWAVVAFVIIQQVDNHLITPMIQRTRVNLSPLVIVLALVVGGALAGLLGVLVAVPITAAVRIVVGHLWRTRVLGQSWKEAGEAMIEMTEPPERLARISRKSPHQRRLFDTQEMQALADESDYLDGIVEVEKPAEEVESRR